MMVTARCAAVYVSVRGLFRQFEAFKPSAVRDLLFLVFLFIFAANTHAENNKSIDPIESIRTDQKANLTIISFELPKVCLKNGGPYVALGSIHNASRNTVSDVDVVLFANGTIVARERIDFESYETKDISFQWSPKTDRRSYILTMIVDPDSLLIDRDRANNLAEISTVVEAPNDADDLAKIEDFNILNMDSRPVAIQLRLKNMGLANTRMSSSISIGSQTLFLGLTDMTEPGELAEVTIPWPAGESFDRPITATVNLCSNSTDDVQLPTTSVPIQIQNPVPTIKGTYQSETSKKTGSFIAAAIERTPVAEWRSIGPTLINRKLGAVGRLGAIAINAENPDVIYAAARATGVWKTTNGGDTWDAIADTLPTLEIQDVDLSPTTPSTVFTTTKNNGIFRSDDAGSTWSPTTTRDLGATGTDGRGLFIHPTNPDQMFLTTDTGLMYSDDAGLNWATVLPISSNESISAFTFDTVTLERAWVALSQSTPSRSGIYVTSLDGTLPTNWRRLNGCPGSRLPNVSEDISIKLAFSQGKLFASHKEPSSWTLFRTTGTSCTVGGITEQSWEAGWNPEGFIGKEPIHRRLWSAIYVDPTNPKFVYAAGTDLWRSKDFGSTFKRITEPHVDHHAFAVHPDDPKIIYTGSDGGLYRSEDRGKHNTWSFIGEGLRITEFYAIADSALEPNVVYGGTQDNGASIYDGSNTTWHFLTGGDSEGVDIGKLDPTLLFELGQEMHQLKRSVGGSIFLDISEDIPTGCPVSAEFGFNSNHFLPHPLDADVLLATCDGLWRGLPWTEVFRPPTGRLTRIAIEHKSDNYYLGSNVGRIFLGIGGMNFQQVFSHPLSRAVVDLEIDPYQPNVIYSVFSGNRSIRVMRLVKSTTGPPTLTGQDLTQGLPNDTINTLAVDLLRKDTIYVGTRRSGIFRAQSFDNWATWTWTPYINGMHQATTVTELRVHPKTGIMRAGTFGRGAYEVDTDNPIGSILTIDGRLSFLRVHDVSTGFGPPIDFLDAEVIVKLDSAPLKAFGLQLRTGADEAVNQQSLDLLRDIYKHNKPIRIEYERVGPRSGRIIRITQL